MSIRPVAKRQSGAGRGGERLGGVLLDDRRDRRRDDKHMLEPGALTSCYPSPRQLSSPAPSVKSGVLLHSGEGAGEEV